MSVDWTAAERSEVEAAIERYPIESARCAALARVVSVVGQRRDARTRGWQLRPRGAARYVVPRVPNPPVWFSHTFVETHGHAVDALTGADGCERPHYLVAHWQHPEVLAEHPVDVSEVDPGIEALS